MPIFEFRCTVCDHVHEFLVRASGLPAETPCPACGAQALDKLMSAAAIGHRKTGGNAGRASCSRPSCTGCSSRCR